MIASNTSCTARELFSANSVDAAELNEQKYLVNLLNSIPGTASPPDHRLCLKQVLREKLLETIKVKLYLIKLILLPNFELEHWSL